MSRIVPQSAVGKVTFFEAHCAKWSENAVAMGSSPEIVALLAEQTEAARAAFNAQQQALSMAMVATQRFHDAVALMNKTGADIIKQVKAKAATQGDPVYGLAWLPVPAAGAPLPPPGKPDEFTVALRAGGALALAWTCKNPRGSSGTLYQVSRRIGTSGGFQVIGTTGRRQFVDETLPVTAAVTYQIVALRSTTRGPVAQFPVSFGQMSGAQGVARVAA